eukprot:TRINITY_DN8520_c0_g1_i1.p1 TRINITY_DN8520_c0_g1~~TRINITY_DN8520_c0_g1_i1.p1  ORF type:complete len:381 (-),score=76.85 TRINITY_DN8520_c0_g1_i1:109-1251(-)
MLSLTYSRFFNRVTQPFTKRATYSTTRDKPHLVLIDGPPVLSKGFHALRRRLYSLHNPPLPVSACFAYVKMVLKIMNEWRYDYIGACWDSPGPTWRHEIYPEYTSRLERMVEEVKIQYPLSQRGTEALGVLNVSVPGYESDDLISSIVAKAKKEKPELEVTIFTPSQDCLQLVQNDVYLYHLSNKFQKFLDEKTVETYYRVPPQHYSDYLALLGHRSQTIEIPRIKEGTASGLIQDFKSVANLIENIDKVPAPLRQQYLENKDPIQKQASLSKLKTTAPVPDLEQFKSKPIPKSKSDEYFKDLNFLSLIDFVSNHFINQQGTRSKRDPSSEKLQIENTLEQIFNTTHASPDAENIAIDEAKPRKVRKKGIRSKEENEANF